jgi:hypothetical protein
VAGLAWALGAWLIGTALAQSGTRVVLEDFRSPDAGGFPRDWKGETGGDAAARQAYQVQAETGTGYLAARNATKRVKKKIAWDPRATPMITWRWRLKAAPADADLVAAVYVSLDTDLLVIPVSTKYVWSAAKPKEAMKEGGMFGATEIVVRSGLQPVGEWVEERVNAYEDFKRIHHHEPAARAWGISLLGGPGVEVDFGPIEAVAP